MAVQRDGDTVGGTPAGVIPPQRASSRPGMDPTLIPRPPASQNARPQRQLAHPSMITGSAHGLAVAFNGGFRSTDPSHPGYYSGGRVAARLNSGQAGLVLRTDGTADVGTWNQEVRMTPAVANVRQNLHKLVDHSDVDPVGHRHLVPPPPRRGTAGLHLVPRRTRHPPALPDGSLQPRLLHPDNPPVSTLFGINAVISPGDAARPLGFSCPALA